nr:MAG TPA: protein of unknown function (DUF5385) [Inoviridae sp.]
MIKDMLSANKVFLIMLVIVIILLIYFFWPRDYP